MSHVPYGADSLLIKSPRWARTASAASPRTDKSLVGHPEGAGRFMSHDRSDAANSYPCQPVPDQPPQDSQRFNPSDKTRKAHLTQPKAHSGTRALGVGRLLSWHVTEFLSGSFGLGPHLSHGNVAGSGAIACLNHAGQGGHRQRGGSKKSSSRRERIAAHPR